jgi:hypothetical protein
MDFWSTISGFALGLLSSSVVVLLYEYNTRPELYAVVDEKHTYGTHPHTYKDYEFYHIIVRNKPSGYLMPSRKPAWSCSANINVLDMDNTILIKGVQSRWTSQPDPLLPAVVGNSVANLIDPARIVLARKVDVHYNGEQHMPVAIKYEGEDYFYIFTNESYFDPEWKKPEWRLGKGNYIIEVILFYENGPSVIKFNLVNKGAKRSDLKLSILTA